MFGCPFCRIIKGQAPAKIVYQDDQCMVIQDAAPRAPVHLLVIPRQHFPYLSPSVPAALLAHMMQIACFIAHKTGIDASGFRVHCNTGPHARQTINHLHLHLSGGRPLGRAIEREEAVV